MNTIKLLSIFSFALLMSSEVNAAAVSAVKKAQSELAQNKNVQKRKAFINVENAQKRAKNLLKLKAWVDKQSKKLQEIQMEAQTISQDTSLSDDEKHSKIMVLQEKYKEVTQLLSSVEKRMMQFLQNVLTLFHKTKFTQGYCFICVYPSPLYAISDEYLSESFTDLTNEFSEALDKAFQSFVIEK